jgi:hypothetical protein
MRSQAVADPEIFLSLGKHTKGAFVSRLHSSSHNMSDVKTSVLDLLGQRFGKMWRRNKLWSCGQAASATANQTHAKTMARKVWCGATLCGHEPNRAQILTDTLLLIEAKSIT